MGPEGDRHEQPLPWARVIAARPQPWCPPMGDLSGSTKPHYTATDEVEGPLGMGSTCDVQ